MENKEYILEKIAIYLTEGKLLDLIANRVKNVAKAGNINEHYALLKVEKGVRNQLLSMKNLAGELSLKKSDPEVIKALEKIKPEGKKAIEQAKSDRRSYHGFSNNLTISDFFRKSSEPGKSKFNQEYRDKIINRAIKLARQNN